MQRFSCMDVLDEGRTWNERRQMQGRNAQKWSSSLHEGVVYCDFRGKFLDAVL